MFRSELSLCGFILLGLGFKIHSQLLTSKQLEEEMSVELGDFMRCKILP